MRSPSPPEFPALGMGAWLGRNGLMSGDTGGASGGAGSLLPMIYDGINWVAYTHTDIVIPPAPPSLGVNQTWIDLTAQRALGTSYQNTSGAPIAVSINTDNEEGVFKIFEVSVDGAAWVTIGEGLHSSGSNEHMTLSSSGPFVVPLGHYYRLRGGAGAQILRWCELR